MIGEILQKLFFTENPNIFIDKTISIDIIDFIDENFKTQ